LGEGILRALLSATLKNPAFLLTMISKNSCAFAMMKSVIFVALLVATLVSTCSAAITTFSASLRWNFAMGSYVKAMPKLSGDGLTVYSSSGEGCAATANTMFALSVDTGSIQWQVHERALFFWSLHNRVCRHGPVETAAPAPSLHATAHLILLPP
jgi:hypothetical protein